MSVCFFVNWKASKKEALWKKAEREEASLCTAICRLISKCVSTWFKVMDLYYQKRKKSDQKSLFFYLFFYILLFNIFSYWKWIPLKVHSALSQSFFFQWGKNLVSFCFLFFKQNQDMFLRLLPFFLNPKFS